MAGDWIKMRSALGSCPKVAAMARAVGMAPEFAGLPRHCMRLLVVGGLHAVWSAVNEHTSDGVMDNSFPEDVDDIAGIAGFGSAMQLVGWMEADEVAQTLTFPNFDQWNTPAKDTTAAERMRKHREKQRVTRNTVTVTRNGAVTVTRNAPVTVTVDKTRQDKTREEEIPSPSERDATSDPPQRRKRSQPAASIGWTAEAGWTGITDADRSEWRQAFPGAVLEQELAKSTAWLRANPTKAGKRNWRAFLVRWLARCQDRGGTNRTAATTSSTGPPDRSRRKFWRGEAQRSMTEAEYREFLASRGRPSALGAELARALEAPKE